MLVSLLRESVSLLNSMIWLGAKGEDQQLGKGEESEYTQEVPVFDNPSTSTSIGTTRVAFERSMLVKFGLPPFFLGGASVLESAMLM